jgi:hypothetical protein
MRKIKIFKLFYFLELLTQTHNSMNRKLKNVVFAFRKSLNAIYFIEHSNSKRSSYICKQVGIKRDIKKDDKDVDMHFDEFQRKKCPKVSLAH